MSSRILTFMLLISPCFKLLDRCIILCIIAHGFPPIVCISYWRRNLGERWLSTILKALSSNYTTLSSLSPNESQRGLVEKLYQRKRNLLLPGYFNEREGLMREPCLGRTREVIRPRRGIVRHFGNLLDHWHRVKLSTVWCDDFVRREVIDDH
jgi:hypothetical protein